MTTVMIVEDELFGHRRGAFTDARADKAGLLGIRRTYLHEKITTLGVERPGSMKR